MDVSDSGFYSDIYSSQLKIYIFKFTNCIVNQSELNESTLLIIFDIDVN
jgi:hypothetical protein